MAAIKACDFAGHNPKPGIYTLDTSAFFDKESGQKLGLGSSAAATVALCKMMLAHHGIFDRDLLLNLALTAHGTFSEGLGSGADVAVSVFGGVISYQKANAAPVIEAVDLRCALPHLIFIDTKRSQNTREFVEKALKMAVQRSDFLADFCGKSAQLCDKFLFDVGDIDQLITIMDELYYLLKSFGQSAGIDIISVEHAHIHKLARDHGGTAKPSGAGGGDVSLAMVPKENRQAFLRELMALGFSVLSLKMHAQCLP
jgi:phosphomevalonate kinase